MNRASHMNGQYDFNKIDTAGFPVYANEDETAFLYVGSKDQYFYWQFSYAANEDSAWVYSNYEHNCPATQKNQWYLWVDNQWSQTSDVSFTLPE